MEFAKNIQKMRSHRHTDHKAEEILLKALEQKKPDWRNYSGIVPSFGRLLVDRTAAAFRFWGFHVTLSSDK
jgi:hypothetical protein